MLGDLMHHPVDVTFYLPDVRETRRRVCEQSLEMLRGTFPLLNVDTGILSARVGSDRTLRDHVGSMKARRKHKQGVAFLLKVLNCLFFILFWFTGSFNI